MSKMGEESIEDIQGGWPGQRKNGSKGALRIRIEGLGRIKGEEVGKEASCV